MGNNTTSVRLADSTTLTLASGVVTVVQGFHVIAAQTGTADDLDTITAGHTDLTISGTTYRPELYIMADSGDTITVKHGTGNIALPGGFDINLTGTNVLHLFYDGTNWMPSYWEAASSIVLLSGQETTDAATIAVTGWTNPVWTPSEFELVVTGLETDLAAIYWDSVLVTFNADTTAANYNSNYLVGSADTASSLDAVGTLVGIKCQAVTAAVNADAGVFGIMRLFIRLPLNTNDFKHVEYTGHLMATSNNEYVTGGGSGVWEDTSAITSITLTPDGGTTFLVGDAGEPTTLDWVLKAHR